MNLTYLSTAITYISIHFYLGFPPHTDSGNCLPFSSGYSLRERVKYVQNQRSKIHPSIYCATVNSHVAFAHVFRPW